MKLSTPHRIKLASPPRLAGRRPLARRRPLAERRRHGDRRPLAAAALIGWIAISPWVWGFAGARPAVANHVFLVLGFGPIALMIVALRPAAFVAVAGGLWLALSPWVLGYAADHTAWLNELVTGSLLAMLALHAAGIPVRRPARQAAGASGRGAETALRVDQ
jgi:hypothetical protein